ncbi:MAG TPA: phosphoribosylanthranilate isomerase [Alphaproteobacteria bacterium]|jgi:phosphoribosylanthranilate isomerase|nr:phosphoribosylanthranilate isomerase [Alphaproteobacteria bacterium]MCB9985692.1 phosphoribosylanthranilate isomerase [Micavibrio sp.]HRK97677.1 phosphoribosylanthranilate isomerase [Alphaproteobacteria bacterium]
MTEIKICGVTEKRHLDVALSHGARFIGLVFYPKSPRFIDPEMAKILARNAPTGVRMIGLFVDPDDAWLDHVIAAVPLDMIQLHGTETPVRVQEIKSKFHLPVIKAFPVATRDDLGVVSAYEPIVDWLLFDAKAVRSAEKLDPLLPGGNGQSFDWTILLGRKFSKPWMLSGGLHAGNVRDALSLLSPDAVDVSSGVEACLGQKDALKIAEFIQTVKNS